MEAGPRELEELVLDGQVAKLLSLVTLEQVAVAWCGYHARTHVPGVEDDDPDWWAVFLLQEMATSGRTSFACAP